MEFLTRPLMVFLGAGAGGLFRYGLGHWIQAKSGSQFPFGTLTVNVSGCLAVGFMMVALADGMPVRESTRLLVFIGILGGYTTFSSLGRETFMLVHSGEWMMAALYVLLSNTLGLAAVWFGIAAGQRIYGPFAPTIP